MEIKEQRYSSTALNGIYFWTATIHKWLRLLSDDSMKFEIIKSLQFLKQKELVDIYGYVIMPNHIHLIWKQNQLNGKEMPRGSLLKFTAHQFKKTLLEQPDRLKDYYVGTKEKDYEFWQRDAMAIQLYSREIIIQKMHYTHNNPLSKRWLLAETPALYRFSSAGFYETGLDEFGLITHVSEIL
jgi:putative transposase